MKDNDLENAIKWLTGWIRNEAPGKKAKCRGCGATIKAWHPAYKYIFGFYRGVAKEGYLCPECGRAVLRAMARHIQALYETAE